jgi:hypothetical protein
MGHDRPLDWIQLKMQPARRSQITGMHGIDQCAVLRRRNMGADRYEADGTGGHQRQGERVIAGVHIQIGVRQNARGLLVVRLGILQRDDARMFGQPVQCLGLDPDAGAAGDVVDHHGQIDRVRDGFDVRLDTGLAGLVVVGGGDQESVHAQFRRFLGQTDGVPCVVGGGAGDDLCTSADCVDHCPEHAEVFLVQQSGGLPRGPGNHQSVAAVLDELQGQLSGDLIIHVALLIEGGNHGSHQSSEGVLTGRRLRHRQNVTAWTSVCRNGPGEFRVTAALRPCGAAIVTP